MAARSTSRSVLQPSPKIAEVLPAGIAALAGLRALIVDDNDTSRRILDEMLTRWGMVTTAVPDGPPPWRAVGARHRRRRRCCSSIARCRAWTASRCRKIRQRPALARTPVIMLTSPDARATRARCRQLHVDRSSARSRPTGRPVRRHSGHRQSRRSVRVPQDAGPPSATAAAPAAADSRGRRCQR